MIRNMLQIRFSYRNCRVLSLCFCVFIVFVYTLIVKHYEQKQIYKSGNLEEFKMIRRNLYPRICLCALPTLRGDELGQKNNVLENDLPFCVDNTRSFTLDTDFNVKRRFKISFVDEKQPCEHIFEKDKVQGKIPKRFHFIWNDARIPSMFVTNLKRFSDLHPKWEFNFWTISHGRELIRKLEPQLLHSYNQYKKDVSRADVLRYVIMYHFGGVYFDLDTYPRIPLDNLLTMDDCLIGPEPMESAVFLLGMRSMLSNAGFLWVQKHSFFRHVLDLLPSFTRKPEVLSIAGPVFLSNAFNSYIRKSLEEPVQNDICKEDGTSIKIVDHEIFEFILSDISRKGATKGCKKLFGNAFFTKCKDNETSNTNCMNMFKKMSKKKRWEWNACVNFALHGGLDRNVSDSVRYVDHKHASTYSSNKKMKYENESKLKEFIPQFNLHL